MKKLLSTLAALLSLVVSASYAFDTNVRDSSTGAPSSLTGTVITSTPYTITQPGRYYLNTDQLNATSPWPTQLGNITIAADNVVLDLNGCLVQNISASQRNNLIIKNGNPYLIYLYYCNNCVISDVSVAFGGIEDVYGASNRIVNNIVAGGPDAYGIYLIGGRGDLVQGNQVRDTLWGIVSQNSQGNTIRDNNIHSEYGISMGPNDTHRGNTFSGYEWLDTYGGKHATD